ncbi:ABC transporter permease [Paraoerskovia sediminicola]|uniref:ABC transporter permease n=1 Tax=Paraoerskovia sediminicola TaxID=1138587 RepID=A0ABM8G1M7_9CELL|nr:carbohydrate ABC transporter permease [Paraoerskovia sediminicola]BDZ41938.1 ABC transporter permease [Paraoerskovia sediminicola]
MSSTAAPISPVRPGGPVIAHSERQARKARRERAKRWTKTVVMTVLTLLILAPIFMILMLSVRSGQTAAGTYTWSFDNFTEIFTRTPVFTYLRNSLVVTLGTTVFAVIIGALAGYPMSRLRGRFIRGYTLSLFVVQSLPVIIVVIPLFVVFATLGLADTLSGVAIIFIAGSMAVTCWMMAGYYDSIPIELEEAAWVDGATIWGGFVRVVLRNSYPGILSAAIFSFLVAWNDYLVATVFLRTQSNYTLPIGLQSFFQQNATDWGPVMAMSVIMLLPPVIVFAVLNRFFSIGGIGGAIK